jgi:hypothetical protein
MCAIFGSKDKDKFIELADLNSYRGQHSFSIAQFDQDSNLLSLIKKEGEFDSDFNLFDDCFYLIGHTQAPTTQSSKIHPCEKNDSMLWHNGIIKQFVLDEHNWQGWDTEFLLDNLDSLSEINGSFACVHYQNSVLQLFRNEISPLFYDYDLNISSTKFKDCVSLRPNVFVELNLKNQSIDRINQEFTTKENPYYFTGNK